jgi:DNA topoisomerase-1
MQLKRGRFGPFLGCTGYPECRNIRKIGKTGVAAPAPVPLDEKCPVDGAQLVKRVGRFGEFISCSNYPKCKYIKQETVGVSCPRPGCKGEIVVKKSKRGKRFTGVRSIRTATSFTGTSPCSRLARTVMRRSCWRRRRRSRARSVLRE